MLDETHRLRIVERANLAPSVHNTQPARWRFEPDGSITVLVDRRLFLPLGDPQGRDAVLSCGAAVEGTVIALADLGLGVAEVTDLWQSGDDATPLSPVANLALRAGGEPDALSPVIERRSTWRGGFLPAKGELARPLADWAAGRRDVVLASQRADIEMLADFNDDISLRFYRRDEFRNELVHWMRLTRSHPDYAHDGMNLEALQLSALEGQGARIAFKTPFFGILDRLGIAARLLSERNKTLSSSAIVLFHRPREESPLRTGQALYRMWLELTRLGLAAWPMAALADDPAAAATCAAHFGIPDDHRLVNLLRIGPSPRQSPRARRAATELVVT